MKALLLIRLKGFWHALRGRSSKKSRVLSIVLPLLLLYGVGAFVFLFTMLSLATISFCEIDLSWLYFALPGLIGFVIALFGTAFSTENQLFSAKDNELLLSMPIRPRDILISRLLLLFFTDLFLVFLPMAPAAVIYILHHGISVSLLFGLLLGCLSLSLLALAVSCILGWLLHQLLRLIHNKAIASTLFTLIFLAVYFTVYANLPKAMQLLLSSPNTAAHTLRQTALPIYWFGSGITHPIRMLLFFAIALLLFAGVLTALSASLTKFLRGGKSSRRSKKSGAQFRNRSAQRAVCHKERQRFFSCAVYLTNSGLGILLFPIAAAAGILFRDKILNGMLPVLDETFLTTFAPAILAGGAMLLSSMVMVSAPAISLEGKSLWILRSMPISGKDVLRGKLRWHLQSSLLIACASVALLAAAYGCSPLGILLPTLISGVTLMLGGILGLCINTLVPRFDWQSETEPCKQSLSILLFMLAGWLLVILCVFAFLFLGAFLPVEAALALILLALCGVTALLYLLLITVCAKRFEHFAA